MSVAKLKVGPRDHGRRMPLEAFLDAEGEPGYRYELEGGTVVVDVPSFSHDQVIDQLNVQVTTWRIATPGIIRHVSFASKVVLPEAQSERHPDCAIYLTPSPDPVNPWATWVPDIAVEVVSESSRKRDYEVKRREYLALGVREYWIVDPARRVVVVLSRLGDTFRETVFSETYETGLLPGFRLAVARLFES
jgi:Uma2 family endonuclease